MVARLLYFCGVVVLCIGCGGNEARPSRGTVALGNVRPSPWAPKKVLIVGIDGLVPDAITAANAPNLQHLSRIGCFSEHGEASAFTWSGPGWSSILTGVWPSKHGVVNNSFWGHRLRDYPDLFSRVEAARPALQTARISSWVGLNERIPTGADEVFRFDYTTQGDAPAVAIAKRLLADSKPDIDLLFTYWALVDAAGHRTGFGVASQAYLTALQKADAELGEVLDALADRNNFENENWLVVVTTDHGGTPDGKHGRDEPAHRTIFVTLAGPSFNRTTFDANPLQVDILPTVLRHLDVPLQSAWGLDGQPLQRE